MLQGRQMTPGKRDALYVHPARFGGDLVGRKPLKFCAWLFDAMGMNPGDELDDLFPGTGVVTRAWRQASGAGDRRRVTEVPIDASLEPGSIKKGDTSPLPVYRGTLKSVAQ